MKIESKLCKCGVLLCLVLAISNCRRDFPPSIELCQLDGLGGADCIEKDGTQIYRSPSELENYIATNPDDEAAFAAWCYDTSKENVNKYVNSASHPRRQMPDVRR